MGLRKILISHSIQTIRNVLKRQILSEFGDATVTESSSNNEICEIVKKDNFDVIISGFDYNNSESIVSFKKICSQSSSSQAQIIGIIENDLKKSIKSLFDNGILNYLSFPIRTIDLKDKINSVCDTRTKRIHDRFNIPNAVSILHGTEGDIGGELINISIGGMLCQFLHKKGVIDLFSPNFITIKIPAPSGYFEIKKIECKLSNLNITSWNSDDSAEYIRMAFVFIKLSELNKSLLERLMEMAKEMNLYDKDEN